MKKIAKYFVLLLILSVSCQTSPDNSSNNYRVVEVVDTVPITRYKRKSGRLILRKQSGLDTIGWREVKTYYRVYD